MLKEPAVTQESGYGEIIKENLSRLYESLPGDMETRLQAEKRREGFFFRAFGRDCILSAEGISLSGEISSGPRALLVSLYALHAAPRPMELEPLKAFKDLPGSMPYQGAFRANSERVLVPYVPLIEEKVEEVKDVFDGWSVSSDAGGDLSFIVHPLPKIALFYIFYLPDEEFPASVTCLFSSNALSFMPLDGLADVAEYTSRGIIEVVST